MMFKLSRTDDYIRYCKPSQMQDGKILREVFKLRENEDGLSGFHFQFCNCDYKQIIEKSSIQMNHKGCLIKLNCGQVSDAVNTEKSGINKNKWDKICLSFEKESKSGYHVLIKGYANTDDFVLDLLLDNISEKHNIIESETN